MNEIITQQTKTPAEMAARLVKLKEAKKMIDDELKEINEKLLEEMQRFDVLTLKTGQFTVSRAKRVTPKVMILEDVQGYFTDKGLPFTTKAVPDDVTMNTIKEMVKAGEMPDGVEAQETEYVSVRVAK